MINLGHVFARNRESQDAELRLFENAIKTRLANALKLDPLQM